MTDEEKAIAAEFEKIPEVIEKPETPLVDVTLPVEKVAEVILTPKEEVVVKEEVTLTPAIEKGEVEIPIKDDENSSTYKQRWKSLDGMVKSEKTKREDAERRNKELEDRIAALEKAPPKKEETPAIDEDGDTTDIDTEIEEARDAYESSIQDGEDKETRSKLYAAFRKLEKQRMEGPQPVDIEGKVEQVLSARLVKQALDAVGEKSIKQYPFLDVTGDKANFRAIAAVKTARDEYIGQGYSHADALALAVEEEAPRYAGSLPSIPKQDKEVDEDLLKGMEAVRKKEGRIVTQQRSKAEPNSLEEAWAELK